MNDPTWQIAYAAADDGTRREHIRHLTAPRFTARVVEIDPFEGTPLEEEGHADAIGGMTYSIDYKTVLCEIDWIDNVPDGQHSLWLAAAEDARDRLRSGFGRWKSLAPVRQMAARVGLNIDPCRSWGDYTEAFCAENDRTGGDLIKRARSAAGVLSTGEVPVLLAMLHAADYDRVADQLSGKDIWWRFARTSGDHAEAVALAIMRT